MDDLISRERLLEIFKCWKDESNYNEAERKIIIAAIYETEYAPAVDAVEVVRCRECRRWHTKNCAMGDFPMYTDAEDFCSWGQRREDGDA